MKSIWAIGKVTGESWMCEGLFENEEDAIKNCEEDEFILLAEVNKRMPAKAVEAIALYWPHLEKREDSKLERMRRE